MQDYSQGGEQKVILDFFGAQVGTFVDIGAADGESLSNTRALVERGWGGLMVEANPFQFTSLLRRYMNNPKIELVNAALFKDERFMAFHCCDDLVSSLDVDHVCKWQGTVDYRVTWVMTLSVETLMKTFPKRPDFLSVDIEGATFPVFAAGLYRWKAPLVCLELSQGERALPFMQKVMHEYEVLFENDENIIYGLR